MSKEQEKQLNKVVSTLLRQLYEMETMAADFTQPNSQQLLTTRMQEFSQGLEQFRQLAGAYSTIQVPTALLKFIDDGGHPDDFVRNTFRAAVGDNQLAAGRVAAVQAMQQELAQAAAAAFPAEANTYNDMVVKKQVAMQQQDAKQQQQQEQQPAASQQPPAPS